MLKTTTFAIAALGCLAAATPAQAGILGSFGATDPAGYTFTVPGGDTVFATATGGAGGSYPDPSFPFSGGLGGVASGAFAVTPGQRLGLVVAGRGQDGGQIPGTDGGCTIAAREGGYGNGGGAACRTPSGRTPPAASAARAAARLGSRSSAAWTSSSAEAAAAQARRDQAATPAA